MRKITWRTKVRIENEGLSFYTRWKAPSVLEGVMVITKHGRSPTSVNPSKPILGRGFSQSFEDSGYLVDMRIHFPS